MDWRKEARILRRQDKVGFVGIYKLLVTKYPEITESMVRRECEKAFLPKYVNEDNEGFVQPEKKQQEINLAPDYNEVFDEWTGNRIIKFGAVSDTHIGSKFQQLTHLNTAYDTFQKEGVNIVYHAGDLTEGESMRQGHAYECFLHGGDEITEYIIEKYPKRDGIITRFITGN